jgi:hypothetical protein
MVRISNTLPFGKSEEFRGKLRRNNRLRFSIATDGGSARGPEGATARVLLGPQVRAHPSVRDPGRRARAGGSRLADPGGDGSARLLPCGGVRGPRPSTTARRLSHFKNSAPMQAMQPNNPYVA